MLPSTARPRAPPSSALVSESDATEPARSGGAKPTTRSVASVPTGPAPSPQRIEAASTTGKPPEAAKQPTNASTPQPAVQKSMPPASTVVRDVERTSRADESELATMQSDDGSIHRPARSGGRPSTSW